MNNELYEVGSRSSVVEFGSHDCRVFETCVGQTFNCNSQKTTSFLRLHALGPITYDAMCPPSGVHVRCMAGV